jgi:hypothetical protein
MNITCGMVRSLPSMIKTAQPITPAMAAADIGLAMELRAVLSHSKLRISHN